MRAEEASERRATWLALAALAAMGVAYALLVVRDFSGPLIGRGDGSYFEFLGFHVFRHYRFGLPPDLGFSTREVGYPQGTSLAYLSWCAERDLLYAGLRRAFGVGPWVQIYCALSPSVGALGCFWLARRELGVVRAFFVALAGSFLAGYAALKFPVHLNIAVLHWASMNIVADHVLFRRALRGEAMPFRWVLGRAALLGLLIGLDVGYVAGFALTHFTVALFALAIFRVRAGTGWRGLFDLAVGRDVRAHPWVVALGAVGLLVGGLVYVPFAWSLVQGARVYRFDGAGGSFWASQLRMLLPILPGAHPGSPWVTAIFGEPEGVGEFSVGWGILAAAVAGGVAAARRRALWPLVPVLVTFALCLAFHPRRLPTLHLFPWFFFNRAAGRATAFFPLWLSLVAVEAPWERWRRASPVVAALIALEAAMVYLLVHRYEPTRFDPMMAHYYEEVRGARGEALLAWPFCIAGANGVGTKELCPYYTRLSTEYANRRFHEKSVVSMYLSRLHPSQLEPRLAWASLFHPDDPDPHRATRETRCFDEAEWRRFDALYRGSDFAGLQLHVDLLPATCVDEFHARYGQPTATAVLPGPGRVEFLPRR